MGHHQHHHSPELHHRSMLIQKKNDAFSSKVNASKFIFFQIRESSSSASQSQFRSRSLAPPSSRGSSPPSSSSAWSTERDELLQYYSSYVGQSSRLTRSRFSQQREIENNESLKQVPINFAGICNAFLFIFQKSQSNSTLHLPIWVKTLLNSGDSNNLYVSCQTSSWRNYSGRGYQDTSQFLGTHHQREARLSTPTVEPPRVFIYHKSTVN